MKIVLQDNSTSLYFCRGNQWAPGFKEALDFQSLENLAEYVRKEAISGVQVVIIREKDRGVDFLPLPLHRVLEVGSSISALG